MSVDHYENFPVASFLCPPRLRPAVAAIYWYARTADDIADEGDASADARRAALAQYRAALERALAGAAPTAAWPHVFEPLRAAIARHALPGSLLHALLDAFEQDVHNPGYATRTELLTYCARSANPIGRLLLHLMRVSDPLSLARSDAICSALQLINFWQDLGLDLSRGRCYLPADDTLAHGVDLQAIRRGDAPGTAGQALVRELVGWSRRLMDQGAPLALTIPGRFGWELRAVVQGGLRILDKIEHAGFATWTHRPTLTALDTPLIGWRALGMSFRAAATHDA